MKDLLGKLVYKAKERLIYDPLFLKPVVKYDRYMHLRMRLLHTIEHPEIAWIYHTNYIKVLSEFGVGVVDSIKGEWWKNPLDYMFIIEDVYSGEVAGGIRLTVADAEHTLPIENIIKKSDAETDISPRIHRFDNVVSEVCAMWLKKKFSERGLAKLLNIAVVSVAPKLQIKYITGAPAEHTVKLIESIGYTKIRIGNEAKYLSSDGVKFSIMMEIDVEKLEHTSDEVRDKILNLRQNCSQDITEEYRGYTTKIDYRLQI
jgi:hypothetical protein